jgi:hypothetical protein
MYDLSYKMIHEFATSPDFNVLTIMTVANDTSIAVPKNLMDLVEIQKISTSDSELSTDPSTSKLDSRIEIDSSSRKLHRRVVQLGVRKIGFDSYMYLSISISIC